MKTLTALLLLWQSVPTANVDQNRTNTNTGETQLTPATVTSGKFGLRGSYSVDGYILAQPLFAVFVNSSTAGNTGYTTGVFFNSETSGGSGLFNVAHGLLYSSYGYWLRIKNDSTNRVYSYSLNGIDFQPIFSEATGTRITENTFGVGVYLAFNATANAGQVRVDSLSVTNP